MNYPAFHIHVQPPTPYLRSVELRYLRGWLALCRSSWSTEYVSNHILGAYSVLVVGPGTTLLMAGGMVSRSN